MTWTTNKPTTPGWYWWRRNKDKNLTCHEIGYRHEHDGLWILSLPDEYVRIDEYGGEWAGPIPEPEEPQQRSGDEVQLPIRR